MEFPIYTYGGGELLVSVFNAIAMIFKSDNNYLTPVGTTAMTLGGIYAGAMALWKGELAFIGRGWLLPSGIAFLLLFSPKTTVWIKDEVALTAPVKVDNIPAGVSFFTSISSVISHQLSKILEETMLPINAPRASNTGILYGAKAVGKLRDVQIQDPILLRNTKEYMRQCYMKPYVIGNFGKKRAKAVTSEDILTFLEENPAKCFGIKAVSDDGSVGQFMKCRDAGAFIKKQIIEHSRSESLLKKFGTAIGMSYSDTGKMSMHIKAMTRDTLGYLDQKQQDVHEWIKQAMVLNANRESYDDMREKFNLPRVFPELVKMQATRGMFQQSLGSIVGAEMAEAMIPAAAHPVMLSLVVMCFVIILPFALLPGGWNYITTGLKLMIWVASWPLFYTIIHSIAMIQLKSSIGNWGDGGLSLIGQGGFTELILWKYGSVQSLISSVPFISFAIVFASPYALSGIASSVANVSSSASIGANMADGNLSLGQRSYNTLTKNQHNEAPSLSIGGGIIDDGGMRIQSDMQGNQIITEYQDSMLTNYNKSDSLSSSISQNLSNAKSQLASLTESESKQTSIIDAQNLDVAHAISSGKTHASNLSISDVEALKRGFSVDESSNESDSVADSKTTATNSHIDAKVPGLVTAATGIGGGTGTSASNTKDVRKDLTTSERQSFNTALDKVKTAAKSDSLTSNNAEDMRMNKSLSSNISKQEQIAQQKAKVQQDVDTYSKQLSYVEQNSGSINRNVNNEVMKSVMQKHPELQSKEQAARWMQMHRSEADEIARPIISNYNPFDKDIVASQVVGFEKNTPSANNMSIATVDSLKARHEEGAAELEGKAFVTDATGEKITLENAVKNNTQGSDLDYNKEVGDTLYENLNDSELNSIMKLEEGEWQKGRIKRKIEKTEENTYDSTFGRALEEVGNNSESVVNSVVGGVMNTVGAKKENKKKGG